MKAITIWQPWATLIAMGLKPYEFRGWAAHRSVVGQRIAIHAGARPVKRMEVADLVRRLSSAEAWTTCLKPEALAVLDKVLLSPGSLPTSHVVCTAMLGEPLLSWKIVGEFGGIMNDSDRDQHANFAWPLTDIVEMRPPVPANGAQGFWDWAGEAA